MKTPRLALLVAAGLLAAPALAQPKPDTVKVDGGVIAGAGRQASGVRIFRGIPYARPPVGALRWTAPQPVQPWTGVRPATEFGNQCMQKRIYADMVFRGGPASEDCLYLNVWTPAKSAGEKLPVLVYFYGGGYQAGDGSEPRYDGEATAAKGVVVVTLNYRLGVFGFLAHPELTAESPHKASGDYGLLDQAAALRWVKANIAAFGGDPNRITIGGESAGSFSVSAQMASPLSRDLIAGAIGESGSLVGVGSPPSLAEAERVGAAFGETIGARDLAALRALPADRLMEQAQPDVRFGPIVDGWFFPRPPAEIYAAGQQAKVPLLAGSNTEEQGADGLLGRGGPRTVAAYRAALQTRFGPKAEAIFAAYPAATDAEVEDQARALVGDLFIGYSTWKWVDLHRRTGQPTYYYLYARPRPATVAAPEARRPTGAVHSAEIEYALGNLDLNKVFAWTPEDRATSATLHGYFVNFIKTGNPNGAGLPPWPATGSGATYPRMVVDAASGARPANEDLRYRGLEAALKP